MPQILTRQVTKQTQNEKFGFRKTTCAKKSLPSVECVNRREVCTQIAIEGNRELFPMC